jgi:hypothetical protein
MRLISRFLVSLTLVMVPAAQATHFRQGELRWRVPDPVNAPLTVEFEIRVAWRSTFLDTVALNYGDGTSSSAMSGTAEGNATDASGDGYTLMRYTTSHTYAASGNYTAFISSCCRVSSLVNAGDDAYRVETRIDLTNGHAHPPLTIAAPVVPMQTGELRHLLLPTLDADGVPVSCRFATPAEMGDTTTTQPPLIAGVTFPTLAVSVNPEGCLLSWNTSSAVAGQRYALQVVVESSQGGQLSRTVSDFIIEMVQSPVPTCSGPTLDYVYVGGDGRTDYVVSSNTGSSTLTARQGGMPGIVSPADGASPLTISHDWTATAADYGRIRAGWVGAQDSQNALGYCATFLITVPNDVFSDGFEDLSARR